MEELKDGNDGLHVVVQHQIHQAQSEGALGLVDLVSNHDGSGRQLTVAVQKEGLTQKIDFKIFTDSVVPDANLERGTVLIWNKNKNFSNSIPACCCGE